MKKRLNRTISVLLTIAMLLLLMPTAFAVDTTKFVPGFEFYFGSYPQTQVKDDTLIATLNEKAGKTDTDNWKSYDYYIANFQIDYMKYTEVELDGEIYRGVYFSFYRPTITAFEPMTSGSNQENNGYLAGNTYWFKYEPLKWQVLSYDEDTDTAVIITKDIIDTQDYYYSSDERTIDGVKVYSNNYEYSNIRTWLNKTFYKTALNDTQAATIITATLENKASSEDYSKFNANQTTDNIYLLSTTEAKEYDYGYYPETDSTLIAGTDYAKSQGLLVNKSGNSYWRLRTAGAQYNTNMVAYYNGSKAYGAYQDYMNNIGLGIRPAATVKLTDAVLSSCVHSDKDSDHICDVCSTVLSECTDENSDHLCDICTKTLSICKDENNDHLCDVCSKVLSVFKDENNDHICDICSKVLSECTDENNDHLCDICGKTVSEHIDFNYDTKCDICGKKLGDGIECYCLCHNTNPIWQIVWRIYRIFCEIFGANKTCDCGVEHWVISIWK